MSLSRVSFMVLSGIPHPFFRVTPTRRPAISSAETIGVMLFVWGLVGHLGNDQ
jgi:hypothetical protein